VDSTSPQVSPAVTVEANLGQIHVHDVPQGFGSHSGDTDVDGPGSASSNPLVLGRVLQFNNNFAHSCALRCSNESFSTP
jgi:hypothetical protein